MKLPTDEETLAGLKKSSNEVNHPCFPCIFFKIMKYDRMGTPSGEIDISNEIFNECEIWPNLINITQRCKGYYYKGVKDDK